MKRKYKTEACLKGLGVSYIFAPREEVMLKDFRVGKLTPRAWGPFKFICYEADGGCTTLIHDGSKLQRVSAAHLLPWAPGGYPSAP